MTGNLDLWPLSSEGSYACRSWRNRHMHICSRAFGNGTVTTCFNATDIRTPDSSVCKAIALLDFNTAAACQSWEHKKT